MELTVTSDGIPASIRLPVLPTASYSASTPSPASAASGATALQITLGIVATTTSLHSTSAFSRQAFSVIGLLHSLYRIADLLYYVSTGVVRDHGCSSNNNLGI